MEREVLIYGQIDSYSSENFIERINSCLKEEPNCEIVARLNTPGGDVDYAFGVIGKYAGLKNKKIVKVDGMAHSMGFYFCCFADEVEALDVSSFIIHRAAYSCWIENDPNLFTEQRKKDLKETNDKLRAAFEAKIDVSAFEAVTETNLDAIFSMDGRIDVKLNAQQAKKVGLVQKINNITPKKKAEIDSLMFGMVADYNGFKIAANHQETNKKQKMTLSEFKTDNPALYAEIVEAAQKDGAEKEKNRIAAWAHFMDVDAVAVKAGIDSGKEIAQVQVFELTEKKFSAKKLAEIEGASPPAIAGGGAAAAVAPKEVTQTAKEKELAEFKAGVLANTTLAVVK